MKTLNNDYITTKHRKTTDGVGCLNTLMNSLNEDNENSQVYETANKLSNPHPAPSQSAGTGLASYRGMQRDKVTMH